MRSFKYLMIVWTLLLLNSCVKDNKGVNEDRTNSTWYYQHVKVVSVGNCDSKPVLLQITAISLREGIEPFPEDVWCYNVPDSLKKVGQYIECFYTKAKYKFQCGAQPEKFQVEIKSAEPL